MRTHDTVPRHRRSAIGRKVAAVVSASMLGIGLAAIATKAEAAPYGGCEEMTLAPHSAGADWCRDHGWTIMRRLAVGPHGFLHGSGLPSCREEDGSGQTNACSWNFPGHHDGNGEGLSYWVGGPHRHLHYVWVFNPLGHGWAWVNAEQADVLAESEANEPWEQCVVRTRTYNWQVKCADGFGWGR